MQYARHKKLSPVVFQKTKLRTNYCMTSSLKHCEAMLFHTNGNQLTRDCNYEKKSSACVTKMKSACMHQNEKQAYHEIPRKTASLFHGCCCPNQPRFQNMFSCLSTFLFAWGQNLHLLVQGNHIWATVHLVSKMTWLSHIRASWACSKRRIIVVAVFVEVVHSIRLIGIAFMLQKSIFCIWRLTIPIV